MFMVPFDLVVYFFILFLFRLWNGMSSIFFWVLVLYIYRRERPHFVFRSSRHKIRTQVFSNLKGFRKYTGFQESQIRAK